MQVQVLTEGKPASSFRWMKKQSRNLTVVGVMLTIIVKLKLMFPGRIQLLAVSTTYRSKTAQWLQINKQLEQNSSCQSSDVEVSHYGKTFVPWDHVAVSTTSRRQNGSQLQMNQQVEQNYNYWRSHVTVLFLSPGIMKLRICTYRRQNSSQLQMNDQVEQNANCWRRDVEESGYSITCVPWDDLAPVLEKLWARGVRDCRRNCSSHHRAKESRISLQTVMTSFIRLIQTKQPEMLLRISLV